MPRPRRWNWSGRTCPALAKVLGPLKTTNPTEYRKAIVDLASETRKQAELRVRNPARADLALEDWKARTHVELVAAQLASTPTAERASELKQAIEARVDVTIRRHQFEVDQDEAAVVKLRERLAQAEANRDKARVALEKAEASRAAKVENRYRALLPKPTPAPTATKPKPGAKAKPGATVPPPSIPTSAIKSSAVPLPSPTLAGHAGSLPTPNVPDHAVSLPSPLVQVEGTTR